ncbi:hypothetical protein LCGC14_1838360 [marine sediment metagenome]|uniref:Uncharacterized protein n=1 Tax=marine sediment metagenome TaxID=412755 RepID=A0A0F9H252_9ZZZZ
MKAERKDSFESVVAAEIALAMPSLISLLESMANRIGKIEDRIIRVEQYIMERDK